MANLYENIAALCEERGISTGRMCNEIGINRSMISDLKNGRKKSISAEYLGRIARYFDVSIDRLVSGGDDTRNAAIELLQNLRDEDRALLEVARNMTPEQVQMMTDFARKMRGIE